MSLSQTQWLLQVNLHKKIRQPEVLLWPHTTCRCCKIPFKAHNLSCPIYLTLSVGESWIVRFFTLLGIQTQFNECPERERPPPSSRFEEHHICTFLPRSSAVGTGSKNACAVPVPSFPLYPPHREVWGMLISTMWAKGRSQRGLVESALKYTRGEWEKNIPKL